MRNTTVGSEVTAYAVSNTKRTTLLTLFFGLLIAVLTACGQPNTAPIEPNAPEPQPDVTELAWHGAAIGYEDDGEALDLSSVDEGVVVIGSGADIWGTRDEFFYAYTNMSGDGALELRVAELSAADPWSKAGVMIRESLEPDAKNAMIHISGGNGSVYQARLEDGASTTNAAGADASATVGGWLRLTRAGDTFTGELSSDGQNWRTIGSYDIDMGEDVMIGMAVTAHASGARATARFTDLLPYSGAPSTGGPTDPTDPTEPTLPVDPVDPVDPTEPTEPGEPGAPGSRYTAPPATLYVATNGNDSNSGRSEDAPLKTLTRAASMVRPGDVVYIRGGTYPIEVQFRNSGTASQPIVWTSYPGEWAVLDGSGRSRGRDSDRVWVAGADHNVFANFEVRNSPRQGIYVFDGANDNLFTGLVITGSHGSGIQNVDSSRNRYEYLTVRDNFDDANTRGEYGQDADGIGISSGDGNVISHVLSFGNSDDGIDAWKSTNTIIEYSVSHSNGRGSHGNGNGVKAGGGGANNNTIVRNTIAFNNKSAGFTSNGGRNITFENNTSYNNRGAVFYGADSTTFRNNIGIGGSLQLNGGREESNSWNLGISNPGFASTDPSNPNFLALASGSPAIDAGAPIDRPFSGSAPDLGALEYGVTIASLVDVNGYYAASGAVFGTAEQLAAAGF